MRHETVRELLGAYALDAVDADEAAAVEAHLGNCPRCLSEVEAFHEAASWLAYEAGDAHRVTWDKTDAWDEIRASLVEAAPPLRLHVQRRRQVGPARRAVVMAAAAVVVVAASAFGLGHARRDHPASRIAAQAASALNRPGTRLARLTGPSGGAATAVVTADGHGYFLASGLPALNDRIYQLWGATGSGDVASLGTVAGPGSYAITVGADIRVVMVTVEDHPQSAPTSPAIVTGQLA